MPKIYLGSLPEPIKCKSFTLTLSLNTDMNAEQLARDIKSLDQAHRAADEALKPYPGLSIGAKVESLSKEFVKLSQRPVETPYRRGEDRHEIRNRLINALGQHSVGPGTDTLGLVEKVVDLCTLLRLNNKSLTESYEALKAQQPVDDFSSKVRSEIRSEISSSLGKSCLEVRSLTTQNLVHMLIDRLRALKAEQGNNISMDCSRRTHEQLSRVGTTAYAKLDVRVKELVDELLKLRQQGERNNSNLSEHDRLEIRERMFKALGLAEDPNARTSELVSLVIGTVQRLHAEVADLKRQRERSEDHARHLRLKAEADYAELQQKHQELYSNYKLLQALSIGQPKGLAPKEKWGVYPIGQGSYRVMRGNEDATPHPVSKAVADAIAGELNGR